MVDNQKCHLETDFGNKRTLISATEYRKDKPTRSCKCCALPVIDCDVSTFDEMVICKDKNLPSLFAADYNNVFRYHLLKTNCVLWFCVGEFGRFV